MTLLLSNPCRYLEGGILEDTRDSPDCHIPVGPLDAKSRYRFLFHWVRVWCGWSTSNHRSASWTLIGWTRIGEAVVKQRAISGIFSKLVGTDLEKLMED